VAKRDIFIKGKIPLTIVKREWVVFYMLRF